MRKNYLIATISTLTICLVIIGCTNSPSKEEYEKLKAENQALRAELDDCKYGPEKLMNEIKLSMQERTYEKAQQNINLLLSKYPSSSQASQAKELQSEINRAVETAQKEKEKRLAQATSKMIRKYDEMRQVTFYQDRNSQVEDYLSTEYNVFYLYISVPKDSKPILRLKIQSAEHPDPGWLHIREYIVKADDKIFNITPGTFDIDRDVWYGWYREVYDTRVDENNLEIVKVVISSKIAKIRCSGDYYRDRIITLREKKALQNVLDAYEALRGEFGFE